jgi:tetrahydromethanopterin S-methyltransferase subunit C
MGRRTRARPRAATTRPPAAAGRSGAPRESLGRRVLSLLNPRKTPTRARIRAAAALFAVLSLLLALLGLFANRAYFQPALLTAILALLWGARAATMR